MKKKLLILTMILVGGLLTGCGAEIEMDIKSDGTVKQTTSMYLTAEEYEGMAGDNTIESTKYSKVERDGNFYYKSEPEVDESDWDDLSSNGSRVEKDLVILSLENQDQIYEFINITVKVPFDIKYTNCEKVDSRTVKYNNSKSKMIIISGKDNIENGKDITLKFDHNDKAVKNNKIYGAKDLVFKSKNYVVTTTYFAQIKAGSSDGVLERLTRKCNGETEILSAYETFNFAKDPESTEKEYDAKNGKYVVEAVLIGGASKTFTYYIDTKEPTISIKNGVLKCTDKKKDGYASGIKSITVNGKSVKNGCKVKKGAKVVVKDKAGNIAKKTIK